MDRWQQFISELRRRRVFRALFGWGIVSFAVLQVIEPIMHALGLGDWTLKVVVGLLAFGFPVTAALSWAYDLRRTGIERTPAAAPEGPGAPASPRVGRLRLALLLLGLGGAAASPGLIYFFVWPGAARRPAEKAEAGPAARAAPSIAVLAFADMSPGKDQEYLSDGIAEEILDGLAHVEALHVVGRTSSFSFKGKSEDLKTIAAKLGVATLLEGSVRKEGGRIRVTAQLINAADGYQLWSQTFNRELTGVFSVEEEIARAVVEALKVTLVGGRAPSSPARSTTRPEAREQYLLGNRFMDQGGSQRAIVNETNIELTPQDQARLAKARTVDPEAHNAFLQGRYRLNRRAEGFLPTALGFFQQAIEKDPNYAMGYVGLADTYYLMFDYPKMKAAATKALEMDDALADAHASLGIVRTFYDWDWSGAEKEIRRAIDLNPGSASARHFFAHYLMARGRVDESLAESKRYQELDPLNPLATEHLAFHYHYARQYDQALEQLRRLIAMEPNLALGHLRLGLTYEQKGKFEEAIAEFQTAIRLNGIGLAELGHVYAVSGKKSEALKVVEKLRARTPPQSYEIALVYVGLRDSDQAFAWLERAYEERSSFGLMTLKVEPRLDSLRSEPHFQDLLRRVGLPQ